jgi:hypothetical protein
MSRLNLSPAAHAAIASLRRDEAAVIKEVLHPLASIVWTDEIPSGELPSGDHPDVRQVLALFAARIRYWNDGVMLPEEQELWRAAAAEFPRWPLLSRLELSPAEREIHERVQSHALKMVDAIFNASDDDDDDDDDADEVD